MVMNHCAKCSSLLSANTTVDDRKTIPKEGDLSICWYCGNVCTFNADGTLKQMTDEDVSQLKETDPEEYNLIIITQQQIRNKIKNT